MTSTLSTKHALSDLAAARINIGNVWPKLFDIACFHCQQAAEKALKGFLQYKDQDPPKIHNLLALCDLCIDLDPSFQTLLRAVNILNPYSVASRYPTESLVTEWMTKTAIDQAQAVYDFALSKVPGLNPAEEVESNSLSETSPSNRSRQL
ncbi:HEPN domain-containing protein [Breznakiellaceae bacterium SP9]